MPQPPDRQYLQLYQPGSIGPPAEIIDAEFMVRSPIPAAPRLSAAIGRLAKQCVIAIACGTLGIAILLWFEHTQAPRPAASPAAPSASHAPWHVGAWVPTHGDIPRLMLCPNSRGSVTARYDGGYDTVLPVAAARMSPDGIILSVPQPRPLPIAYLLLVPSGPDMAELYRLPPPPDGLPPCAILVPRDPALFHQHLATLVRPGSAGGNPLWDVTATFP